MSTQEKQKMVFLALVCVAVFTLLVGVWDITAKPMLRNYAKCGTISLCR